MASCASNRYDAGSDTRAAYGQTVDWYSAVFELIDMRSFSNLWYWIALAVVWSTTSHWVLGVPYDMVQRAARHGGEAETDLEDMVRININRLLYIAGVSGLWLLGIISAFVTSLAILGFWYDVEFAQAVFLLAAPMTIVGRHRAHDPGAGAHRRGAAQADAAAPDPDPVRRHAGDLRHRALGHVAEHADRRAGDVSHGRRPRRGRSLQAFEPIRNWREGASKRLATRFRNRVTPFRNGVAVRVQLAWAGAAAQVFARNAVAVAVADLLPTLDQLETGFLATRQPLAAHIFTGKR